MLTDSKLKSLKPKDKLYKVADRDGLYVTNLQAQLLLDTTTVLTVDEKHSRLADMEVMGLFQPND
ncbi:hypothetical protein [Haemophilus parahaemolyticus]|uniref:hypothetical protein n=1 Tax=Haemophilus parahaemolyticus TaxID=735 RepID=UPI003F65E26A